MLLTSALVLATTGWTAPPAVSAQSPSFRGGVDMVLLNVTAMDRSGGYVTDLRSDEFRVLEDGRPQQIRVLQHEEAPLSVALLIDTSGSMTIALPVAQQAATGFVRALGRADQASIIPFKKRMHQPQAFTADAATLAHAIRATTASGDTALYDTVYATLHELARRTRLQAGERLQRQAILLLTDGLDSASYTTFDELLETAVRSDVAVYAIGLDNGGAPAYRPEDARFVLGRLARQTGGRAYFPEQAGELNGIYREIQEELSHHYLLAYRSDDSRRDGRFRQLAVRIERDGVTARARPGYYAGR
jgi:Ca-activated chloride channel family protein